MYFRKVRILKVLLFVFILGQFSYAQLVSDRLGGISSTPVVPRNGLQVELGQMLNLNADYASPLLRNSTKILLRQGLSEKHEVRLGYNYEIAESSFAYNYEWLSAGVKLEVANYEKLHISAIATWGLDLRTITSSNGPRYFLELSAPWEYHFSNKLNLRSEIRFNHQYEQSDINLSLNRKLSQQLALEAGLINNFFLAKRGHNGDRPYWHEFSYLNAALQANFGSVAIDVSVMRPVATGADQLEPSDGFVFQAGVSIYFPHQPWNKNKVKVAPEVY